jgi:hypothetical protein
MKKIPNIQNSYSGNIRKKRRDRVGMVKIPYGSKLIDVDVEGKLLGGERGRNEAKSKKRDVVKDTLRYPINTKRRGQLFLPFCF